MNSEWHVWLKLQDHLAKIAGTPSEGHYFGDCPDKATDQSFELLNLMAQHTLTREMLRIFGALSSDIRNLAASLAKCRFIFRHQTANDASLHRFIETETEFLVTTCRSVFDLLQEAVADHWKMTVLADGRPKQVLPKKRFKEVMRTKDDGDLTPEHLEEKYGLTPDFAQWYVSQALFFALLKDVRDG